jgi:hypothetical protein
MEGSAALSLMETRSARLTDAFTKLLMPGTSMREINDCVISKKRFVSIDRR